MPYWQPFPTIITSASVATSRDLTTPRKEYSMDCCSFVAALSCDPARVREADEEVQPVDPKVNLPPSHVDRP